eukprot:403336475
MEVLLTRFSHLKRLNQPCLRQLSKPNYQQILLSQHQLRYFTRKTKINKESKADIFQEPETGTQNPQDKKSHHSTNKEKSQDQNKVTETTQDQGPSQFDAENLNTSETSSGEKVYIPRSFISFDENDKFLLYEISSKFRRLAGVTVPYYFAAFSSAMLMIDSYATLMYLQACMYSLPFLGFIFIGNMMHGQGNTLIKKIYLIQNKDEDVVEEVEIENLRGYKEIVSVKDIRKLQMDQAKKLNENSTLKYTYPVFIQDLMMLVDIQGTIHNLDVFKAVMNGYKIDLTQVQEANEDTEEVQVHNVEEDHKEKQSKK